MSLVKLNWRPNPKELRQFGGIILVGFLLIGAAKLFWPWSWPIHRAPRTGVIFMIVGLVVGSIGLTGTRLALPFYYAWLSIAFVLGNIMSRVIVAAIFDLVITPMRLFAALIGRDKLALKNQKVDTYWHDISLPREPEKYERQF